MLVCLQAWGRCCVKLKRSALAMFIGPCLPLAAISLPFVVYLPPYYAGTLGLDLGTVGLIFFLVRLFDMPLDPVLGHLMDETRGRFGRYRPWVVAGGFVMMLTAFAVYMAEPGLSAAQAFIQLMLLYVGYSLTGVGQAGWGASLSNDYNERSRIFGWWQAANLFGMVVVLSLPPLVGYLTGRADAAQGIHAMGWYVILLAPLTTLVMAAGVPERPAPADRPKPKLADFAALARSDLVRKLMAIDLLIGIGPGITGAMFIFFFEHRLGFSPTEAGLLLLFYFVAGFAAVPFWAWLAVRIGKHRAGMVAALAYCVTQAGITMMPGGQFALAAAGMVIAGIPYAAGLFLLRAMLADVADVDQLETGLDRNGLLQAVLTTTSKIAHAAPIVIVYPILQWIGFQPAPGASNTPEAIREMTLLFAIAPVALMSLAGWLMWRWPLGPERHAAVQAALAARDNAPRAAD